VSSPDSPDSPLDVATLALLASRAETHSLVCRWVFHPDAITPRRLELALDGQQYPPAVDEARLEVRWFEGGDYTFHYLELRGGDRWQCRWDCHTKPGAPDAHFHPPPNATGVKPSEIPEQHHLGVLFFVLDWVEAHVESLHD